MKSVSGEMKKSAQCLVIFLGLILLCEQLQAQDIQLTNPIEIKPRSFIIGINGTSYQSFIGIRYAKPPIDDLRFANPQKMPVWKGNFSATQNPPPCIQMNFLLPQPFVYGEEDCLYLNVYRPHQKHRPNEAGKPPRQLPVMVYIHGGAFFSGSMDPSLTGPGYFMDNGSVILVVMQYRLSTLGFLSTGDKASPGNFGLKDQSMALKWVKENIAAFGGDPQAITIFGQSAGAASVHMHMLSPLSRGLFSRVIAMSGNAIGPYNYPTQNPLELTKRHAKVMGIEGVDYLTTQELVNELRNISAEELISSVAQLKFFDVDSLTIYRLVVEPNAKDAFLTDTPLNLLRSGQYMRVPLMAGLLQVEGAVRAAAMVVNQNLTAQLNAQLNELIPQLMELQLEGHELQQFTEKIIDRYLPNSGQITPENEESFIKLYSERSFSYPHYKLLQILKQGRAPSPVYSYYFDYRGQHSYAAVFTGTLRDFGVVHCDDLLYLFEAPLLVPGGLNEQDRAMSRRLVQHYVDFASHEAPMWERTSVSPTTIGPYMSLADHQLKYYSDWEDIVQFWDQANEF